MATGKALDGKPYAGNPHVRFDEGEVASAATPRRGSLLYKKLLLIAAVAVAAFMECIGLGAGEVVAAPAPLRVAVFVDKGARNTGVFRWLEITARMKDAVATPVDGEAVRAGALDKADVLVMPGGSSVSEAKTLGPDGREKVKAFIKNGGGYVGTCAGCCLLMEPANHHPDMLHLIPFKFGPSGGKADMSIAFNERAKALAGIGGKASVWYSHGPVLLPSKPVEGANVEVVATYDSDLNSMSEKERPSRAGCAAAVAGTYGKGRLFVLAVHPEAHPNNHYILKGAFRYVTGRELSWDYPQRRRGQLVVGFLCDDSFGVETARLIQRLVTNDEFDVVPLNTKEVECGGLRNVDAVLAPGGVGAAMLKASLGGKNAERAKEFVARGGRVIAWGCAAEVVQKGGTGFVPSEAATKRGPPGVTCVADGEAALAALRAFAAEPVPEPAPLPAKVAKPIRAGIYQDPNNSNIIIARILAFAPEYELKFLSPEDYVNGGLDGIDLIVQPGGGCTSQYKALGEKGAEALKRFVLGGGKYYGVCAGAFMALQQSLPNRPRLGLAPFKGDDPAHYRGSAPIRVKFTEEGQKALDGVGKSRTVVYAGGPAMIPGEPVADSDIKILGSFAGRKISTTSGKPVEDMLGKGAFAGGRAGKGKVFVSCPHPEFEEANHDIVRSGIAYLTGVAPSPIYLNRTRGAISVRYRSSDKASAEFLFGTLLRDRRFHVWPGKDGGTLAHLDAVVLTDKTDADEARQMNAFIARGGRVVAVCDTPEKRKAAELLKGAVVVESYAEVVEAILAKARASDPVEDKIRGLMDENRTAGMAVVLVKGDKVVYQNAFGYRDKDTREPLDTNDIFRIASISKSFSGVSIMQLVEAGKMSLDDDVNDILGMDIRNPRYPDVPVTIRMLLSHTSSMNDGGGYRDLTYVDKTKTDINLIREKAWLPYPPGKGYKYCNRALNIIGLVIEKVSGERFDEYVLNHILKPIGADNAGFNLDKLDESTFTKLYLYSKKRDQLVPGGGYTRINEQKVADGTYTIGKDGCYWSPTGGMKISAPNLAKWMLTLKNGGVAPNGNRILSAKGCKTLLTPVIDSDPGTQYCLTTRVETRLVAGKKLVGHTGAAHGLYSCMYFCPDEDWGIVCICSSAKPDKVNGMHGIRKCLHDVVNLLYDLKVSAWDGNMSAPHRKKEKHNGTPSQESRR